MLRLSISVEHVPMQQLKIMLKHMKCLKMYWKILNRGMDIK